MAKNDEAIKLFYRQKKTNTINNYIVKILSLKTKQKTTQACDYNLEN